MKVEIKGIGIPNKGAELMLAAIIEKLEQRYQNVEFVVDPNTDFLGRSRFGLYQKGWLSIKGIQLAWLFELVPQKLLQRFGIVKNSQVDVIIDASGFCYSDSFGFKNAYAQVGKYIDAWIKQGKVIIFMPQAYGPFKDSQLASCMLKVLSKAHVFYARDAVSKQYLSDIGLASVPLAPDFTSLVKGIIPSGLSQDVLNGTCIILNNRMLEKSSKEDGQVYVDSMIAIANSLLQRQANPYFLLHEGEDDLLLTQKINAQLPQSLPILQFGDPKEIKGVIGTARLVISSRFHGLVSALSQGIPSIATGWSHKYQMLMDDYAVGEFMLDHANVDELLAAVEHLLDDQSSQSVQAKIRHNAQQIKQLTEKMWDDIFITIDKKFA